MIRIYACIAAACLVFAAGFYAGYKYTVQEPGSGEVRIENPQADYDSTRADDIDAAIAELLKN